jgi:aminobenzoyl-glutamate utilization protein B
MRPLLFLLFCLFFISHTIGQTSKAIYADKSNTIKSLESKADHYADIAMQIWDLAELGFLEHKSIELLINELEAAGFAIETGVAGMPTAFIAEWGSGGPIIGMLAEYDALPGMSQAPVPVQKAREEGKPGHACGHHMFGTASVAGAIATKEWLEQSGTQGTIRLYGTPAEEGGGAKVFMVRSGLFDDVDAVLTWHPGDRNASSPRSTLSAIGAKFTFTGKASHAAKFPERGRSALDGVEAMNDMVNLMREHIPQESRIHYSIEYGGGAPNVVPAKAVVSYIIRHPDMPTVKDLLRRVRLAADGAAVGTETSVSMEIQTGYFNIMPNMVLSKLVHDNLSLVGGVVYTNEDIEFANVINESFKVKVDPGIAQKVMDYDPDPNVTSASTDVGDISWVVPTTSLSAATWVPGTSPHSWQAVAAGGMDIGMKGMMVAAKAMAISAMELFNNPDLLQAARQELHEKVGPGFKYEALIGDIDPPLEFRVGY